MNFSFDATAKTSQSTTKPRLAGNAIYDVQFDGCETQDIQGVKDVSQVYKVLKLKFSNEKGLLIPHFFGLSVFIKPLYVF